MSALTQGESNPNAETEVRRKNGTSMASSPKTRRHWNCKGTKADLQIKSNQQKGLGDGSESQRTALSETQAQFQAPAWQLTTICNSPSGDLVLFSGLCKHQVCTWYTDVHTGKHTRKMVKLIQLKQKNTLSIKKVTRRRVRGNTEESGKLVRG